MKSPFGQEKKPEPRGNEVVATKEPERLTMASLQQQEEDNAFSDRIEMISKALVREYEEHTSWQTEVDRAWREQDRLMEELCTATHTLVKVRELLLDKEAARKKEMIRTETALQAALTMLKKSKDRRYSTNAREDLAQVDRLLEEAGIAVSTALERKEKPVREIADEIPVVSASLATPTSFTTEAPTSAPPIANYAAPSPIVNQRDTQRDTQSTPTNALMNYPAPTTLPPTLPSITLPTPLPSITPSLILTPNHSIQGTPSLAYAVSGTDSPTRESIFSDRQWEKLSSSYDRLAAKSGRTGEEGLDATSIMPLLLKSKLDHDKLLQVMALCDLDQDGKFTKLEFALAISMARRMAVPGAVLPDTVPQDLLSQLEERCGLTRTQAGSNGSPYF